MSQPATQISLTSPKGEKLSFPPADIILVTLGFAGQTLLFDFEGTGYYVQENLTAVEQHLRHVAPDYPHFLRINRQYLANLSFVKRFDKPQHKLTFEVLSEEDELVIDNVPPKKNRQIDDGLAGVFSVKDEPAKEPEPTKPNENEPTRTRRTRTRIVSRWVENDKVPAEAKLQFLLGYLATTTKQPELLDYLKMTASPLAQVTETMSKLKELGNLKEQGILTDAEFQKLKKALLKGF